MILIRALRLWFHTDTFQAALMQTPENHWCLKRREPPRLPPGVDGYYYNFATDTVADDVSYILLLGELNCLKLYESWLVVWNIVYFPQ